MSAGRQAELRGCILDEIPIASMLESARYSPRGFGTRLVESIAAGA
jgi:hypothetical protein